MGILKTAVKVGVASSVHGRLQRRQQQRWAAQDQAAAMAAAPAPPPPAPAPPAPPVPAPSAPASPVPAAGGEERLAQLAKLGDLKNAGILTEAEFEQERPAS